jgi:hypothetical protein
MFPVKHDANGGAAQNELRFPWNVACLLTRPGLLVPAYSSGAMTTRR